MHPQQDLPTFKSGTCRKKSHDTRSWRHVQADLVQRTGLDKEETSLTPTRHLVLVNLRGNSERGEYFIDGRRKSFVPRKPGAILFIPEGCNWRGWEAGASTAAYLSLSVEPSFVELLRSGLPAGTAAPLAPDLGFEDPIILHAARGIGAEIGLRSPLSTPLVEAYAVTIFAQLMRRQSHVRTERRGGLASSSLNRVIETIDDDPSADLSLADLAKLAGLSIPHFCRAFRQTLGCPPHAFIVKRRIDKAKDCLQSTEAALTEVALTCGFSSSSHFSNVFRREVGVTPLEYRRSWRIH